MSLGKEVSSLVKWTSIGTMVNAGLVLVVFGLLARDNGCSQHLIMTFYQMAGLFLIVGGIALFFAVIGSAVDRINNWKKVRALRRERARLLLELDRLKAMQAAEALTHGQ